MIKRMMLLSASLLMLNTAWAGSPAAAPDLVSEDKDGNISTAIREKTERIQTLTAEQGNLVEKQKQKRKELLKNNPKLRRMYLQILKQARQLALELDADREISQINDRLHEIGKNLDKERQELDKLNERIKLNTLKNTEKNK